MLPDVLLLIGNLVGAGCGVFTGVHVWRYLRRAFRPQGIKTPPVLPLPTVTAHGRTPRGAWVPVDLVDSPTLTSHDDGHVSIDWTHGRGPTVISAEMVEDLVAQLNARAD